MEEKRQIEQYNKYEIAALPLKMFSAFTEVPAETRRGQNCLRSIIELNKCSLRSSLAKNIAILIVQTVYVTDIFNDLFEADVKHLGFASGWFVYHAVDAGLGEGYFRRANHHQVE